MKFSIYRRFIVEVLREDNRWVAYKPGNGTRVPITDLVIPARLGPEELKAFLDDHYHEYAMPGRDIAEL